MVMSINNPRYFNSYYFTLDKTGVEAIDDILYELACAGKGYHNTSEWNEEGYGEDKRSCIERIQDAANKAAEKFKDLENES